MCKCSYDLLRRLHLLFVKVCLKNRKKNYNQKKKKKKKEIFLRRQGYQMIWFFQKLQTFFNEFCTLCPVIWCLERKPWKIVICKKKKYNAISKKTLYFFRTTESDNRWAIRYRRVPKEYKESLLPFCTTHGRELEQSLHSLEEWLLGITERSKS